MARCAVSIDAVEAVPALTLTTTCVPPPLGRRVRGSVLVVEDQRDAREMLAEYLEFCGFVVHTAADGLEAIAVAMRVHPPIILMDLMMPRMDGWEATRRLKADPRTGDITIIALSAHSSTGDERSNRSTGWDDFIEKPCDLAGLAAVLRDFFYRRCH